MIDEDTFAEGMMFDGSSIAGWKAINEFDMKLMPDPDSACLDPFFAETTLVLVCDMLEPLTGEPYNRDPRSIAKKAAGLRQIRWASATPSSSVRRRSSSSSTTCAIPPLPTTPDSGSIESNCRPTPTPSTRAAISATASASRRATSRCRRSTRCRTCARRCSRPWPRMGVKVEKHHHEVGSAQHELGTAVRADGADGGSDADL